MQASSEIIEKFMSAYAHPQVVISDEFDDENLTEEEREKKYQKRSKLEKLMRERDDALAKEAEEEKKKQIERDMWITEEWIRLEEERQTVTVLLTQKELQKTTTSSLPSSPLNISPSVSPRTGTFSTVLPTFEGQDPIIIVPQSPALDGTSNSEAKKPPLKNLKLTMNKAATIADLGRFGVGVNKVSEESRVMKEVPKPLTTLMNEAILFGLEGIPNIEMLRKHLSREGRLDVKAAKRILKLVQELFKIEPNVLELLAPITVIGDIHGQFYDLLQLIERGGDPSTTRYLFLGDYVDRGMFSTECCFLLFALKLCYPNNIFMLRGNHESRVLTEHFNFKTECQFKYNLEIYDLFMDCFDCLPLCGLVLNQQGTFFCTHGGIGPELESIQQIKELDRFIEIPEEGNYCDLIWSDPIELDEDLDEYEIIQWSRVEFQFNSARGCGWCYGYASVDRFLDDNHLLCIVRAHEVQRDGIFQHTFGLEERSHPPVITVFSAPNYCDVYENSAGIMRINIHSYTFERIEWVDHPYYLPNFVDAISFSLPFIAENLMKIFAYVLSIPDSEVRDDIDSSLQKKIRHLSKISAVLKKARLETEDWVNPSKNFAQGQDPFSQALRWDKSHEKRPRGASHRKLQRHGSCRF